MEFAKLRVTAYWGPLVALVRGREGIIFTSFQVKIRWSQNSVNTLVGFTLRLDKIYGTREEFTVKINIGNNIKTGPVFNNT